MDSKARSLFGRFGYAVTDTMRLDLIASRFELEGDGDYAPVAGNRATGLPTSSQRGTPPGVPAPNRHESVALSLHDPDLGKSAERRVGNKVVVTGRPQGSTSHP